MGGLIITRNLNEKIYGFVTHSLQAGEYIELENMGPCIENQKENRYKLIAPRNLVIIRGEFLQSYGGFSRIIEHAKSGNLIHMLNNRRRDF
jgi:hypothetical protein